MKLPFHHILEKGKTSPFFWLFLICAFHFLFNIWWLYTDNHAISTDEETHMIMARDYYTALFPHQGDTSPGARWTAIKNIRADVGNPVHPPLLHLSGAVLVRILGYGIDRLAFTNTLFFMAALVGFYLLMALLLSKEDALFATLVFSLTPMVYMASRYFMTDFLSMALVIWVIYALWKSEGYTRIGWTLLFGLLNGLALLTRSTAVLYYTFPCVLAGVAGLSQVCTFRPSFRFEGKRFARLCVNMTLAATIGILLAAPWYLLHGEQFYHHWMKPQTLQEETPLSIVEKKAPPPLPARPATPPQKADVDKEKETPSSAHTSLEERNGAAEDNAPRWRLRLHRRIPWTRYPVFVINNAVFLPLFLLSLGGMLCACFHHRFRKQRKIWSLLSWLWGSYMLLTLLLSFSTPRYALQALPALAFFSVLPLLLLPGKKLRRSMKLLYIAILLFQFGTLTIHAFTPLPEIALPLQPDREFQEVYDDPGLYVYKSVLHASSAYGRMQAPMKENFKDRLFLAMLNNEQKQPYSGIEANYARLNMRGMLFEEQHYWLDREKPNPYRRKDIPAHLKPYRNFRHYGWSREITQILPVLPMVDYVVYTTEDISEETEQQWLAQFRARGFELIDRFYEERFGQVSARHYAVVARREQRALPKIEQVEDLSGLSLEALYRLRHAADWHSFSSAIQQALEKQLLALFQARGEGIALNESMHFLGASISHEEQDLYTLNLLFKTTHPPKTGCRLLVQGVVAPEDMARYFDQKGDQPGQFRWSFEPSPSPLFWPEKGYLIIHFPIAAKKTFYELSFAFYLPGSGLWGKAAKLGGVDFGTLSEQEKAQP